MKIRLKLIIAGIILCGAVAYLAAAGMRSGWVYYLEVDRFLTDSHCRTQRVRLHGKVDATDFSVTPGSLTAKFNMLGNERKLAVVYHGVIPDQFQAGREVVVEGRLNDAGTFQADVLLTKCSGKYESKQPNAIAEAKP